MLYAALVLASFVLLTHAVRSRPSPITLTLLLAFAGALVVPWLVSKPERLGVLLAVDAAVVVAGFHYARRIPPPDREYGRIVASISAIKIAFTIVAVLLGTNALARASAVNSAFIVQILVAGGMADGIIVGLGNRLDRLGNRLGRVFHRVEDE